MRRNLWREPLIHFLLFGAFLFTAHALWTSWTDRTDRQLIVPTAEISRQASLYAIENGRPPSETELNGIILAYVEEAVLAREARRLGLDEDDTVIRRRLAQKMRLVADATPVDQPDDNTLRTWFDTRSAQYNVDERRRLQHVYFSDRDREDPRADAMAADLTDWRKTGDPFIVDREVGPLTQSKLQQEFGEAFSQAAFAVPQGQWSDPVRSPFGVHRIRVSDILEAQAPDFDRQRERILVDYLDQARREASAVALQGMLTHYDVIVEE